MDNQPEIYGDSNGLSVGKAGGSVPSAAEVANFHTNADVDVRAESLHHTLGSDGSQASPGDHTHDGGSSALLLTGFTITGSRGGNAALPSIIDCLKRLGAKDSTTA